MLTFPSLVEIYMPYRQIPQRLGNLALLDFIPAARSRMSVDLVTKEFSNGRQTLTGIRRTVHQLLARDSAGMRVRAHEALRAGGTKHVAVVF
jgi:hypothetical protein